MYHLLPQFPHPLFFVPTPFLPAPPPTPHSLSSHLLKSTLGVFNKVLNFICLFIYFSPIHSSHSYSFCSHPYISSFCYPFSSSHLLFSQTYFSSSYPLLFQFPSPYYLGSPHSPPPLPPPCLLHFSSLPLFSCSPSTFLPVPTPYFPMLIFFSHIICCAIPSVSLPFLPVSIHYSPNCPPLSQFPVSISQFSPSITPVPILPSLFSQTLPFYPSNLKIKHF